MTGKGSKGAQDLAILLMQYMRIRLGRKWSDREAFERWQERQVLRHLRFVQSRAPFYKELWGERPLTQWRQFPIIDKTDMMEHFDRLNTAGIRKETAMEIALEAETTRNFRPQTGDITVGLSSGTSGNRGLFLVSRREQSAWAGTMLAKLLPGPLWQPEKIAFFLRANSNLYESVRGGKLQFEYFDLLEPIGHHVKRLEAYQPSIWAAPPSLLRLLAEEKRTGRLISVPRRIISVAEVLDPLDARVIQATFGLPIHQVYQCTEGFLASTCSHGTLHLNEDIVHIEKEYVQEDPTKRKFVPVVTDFSRTTQPIVRYRLNDVLTEAEPCPCGSVFTAIERIEGRCDDIFYMKSLASGKLTPVFPDYVTRAVLAASPAIEEYRVIQHGEQELEVELQLAAGADRETIEEQVTVKMKELLRRLHCRLPAITFASYSFTPGVRKLRRVERRWQMDE
ncbi:putative adenylate-forming enzyme [Paenibacillus phyllosphaerae]|uniref:Putative adenylate-forming enzyme n=1 Tax=Paenibacillus phyllosphaerae TaxID=274593 RepID=A0A7W5AWC7_9BACL|nr:F390 synthetase-related protein [Paenibacillus phyllosphaerae]MBB3109689.1 putative adenylate-forming enzyme [Paenibacillus phyllosphaerae]